MSGKKTLVGSCFLKKLCPSILAFLQVLTCKKQLCQQYILNVTEDITRSMRDLEIEIVE